jgi:serine/threonine protein kinase
MRSCIVEVITSATYSEKADVYSYGVVIWEVLTRQAPWQGMQPMQIAYGVVHQVRLHPTPQLFFPFVAAHSLSFPPPPDLEHATPDPAGHCASARSSHAAVRPPHASPAPTQ